MLAGITSIPGSAVADLILKDFENQLEIFYQSFPKDYKKAY